MKTVIHLRAAMAAGALMAILLAIPFTAVGQASAMRQYVAQAHEDDRDPGLVTGELIDQGFETARAAQAVARQWRDCGAAQAAVAVAVTRQPAAATDVVTAVGSVGGCACDETSGWARNQLDARIRFEAPQRPIELPGNCSCMAAAVEAGAAALPEQADAIVLAGLEVLQEEGLVLDAVGERGGSDHPEWSSQKDFLGRAVFRRKPKECEGDRNPSDDFDPAQEWVAADAASIDAGANACEPGEGALVITEFAADSSGAGHVQLTNFTDNAIDMTRRGLRLGASFQEETNASVVVPLTGRVAPGESFLVAGRGSPLAGQAQQVVNRLAFAPGDLISLQEPSSTPSCDCAESVTTGAFRGSQNRVAGTNQPSPADHKLARLLGTHEHTTGYVVDAVGQVGDESVSPLPATLNRQPGWCERDVYELDPFAGDRWQQDGDAAEQRCALVEGELVISGFVNGQEHRDAIRLHNSSSVELDLEQSGYYVEVYEAGRTEPSHEIALTGKVAPGATYTLANDDVAQELRQRAEQLDNEVTLDNASAVVVARRMLPRPLNCQDDLVAFMSTPLEGPFLFIDVTPTEGRDPVSEPDRVDPEASPN